MREKTIYCGYCGVELSTIVFITKDNMHIQKAEILTVCDTCSKPTTVIYGQGEFKKEKRAPAAATVESTQAVIMCNTCGCTYNDGSYCRACAAMGQKA